MILAKVVPIIITIVLHVPGHHHKKHHPKPHTVPQIISYVWCGRRKCWQGELAKKVAWCESTWRTWAVNGSHYGLFQMGYPERMRYGGGDSALAQSRAAHRYYEQAGWGPWYASRACWG